MPIPNRFVKMAGGGNDFLVFEADGRSLSEERPAIASRSSAAAGSPSAPTARSFSPAGESSRIHLDYFNADGGLASFCANGTRCAARYAVIAAARLGRRRRARDGLGRDRRARRRRDRLARPAAAARCPGDPIAISGAGLPATGTPMHVGVPHLVVLWTPSVRPRGARRRARSARRCAGIPLLPEGANVNFVRVAGPDRIAVRTFERGVEGGDARVRLGNGRVRGRRGARRALVTAPVVCETQSGAAFTSSISADRGRRNLRTRS